MFRIFDHVTFDAATACQVLNWSPRVDLDEALARTASWVRWAFRPDPTGREASEEEAP